MQQDDLGVGFASWSHRLIGLSAVFVSFSFGSRSLAAQEGGADSLAAVRIAVVEDGRGKRGQSPELLRSLARDLRSEVRAQAVRALGRQQNPALLPDIYPALRDRVPAVRIEAINAAGQALTAFRTPRPEGRALLAAAIDSLSQVGPNAMGGERGVAARTLGRLPYPDSALARVAESAILRLSSGARGTEATTGVLHGLYSLARARRTLGNLSSDGISLARTQLVRPGAGEAAGTLRRLAMLTLSAAGAADEAAVTAALRDGDEQVRRLGVVSSTTLAPERRASVLRAALRDLSPMVRHEVVRGWRGLAAAEGCGLLIESIGDADPSVVLAAIDGLSATCRDKDRVADTLLSIIDANRSDSPIRARGRAGWHTHAHALVALARTNPDRARPIVRREVRDATFWGVRVYAARAAAIVGDTASLRTLASSGHGNVREAALGALVALVGHGADDLLLSALDATEYHVIAEAAQGLKGTPDGPRATDALVRTLVRLTSEGRDNTRDPRVAILDRLEETGSAAAAERVRPLLSDFDSTVARRAAAVLTRWTGQTVQAAPQLKPAPVEALAPLMRGEWRARVVMSPETGGGSFELRLFPREAPYTVARFVRLARAGFYNGLTFHRVEPGFVTQGGSPAATEYVGDGPFLRDELGLRSHTRGTLGISTRGRDTGDAQMFINLTDNFRLDHDYTVFAEITRGRAVAESVIEADVIQRIEIIPPAGR